MRTCLSLALIFIACISRAEVCVEDDKQRQLCLAQPAQRIIALSPGATELLYSAGAGDQLIAAVSFSDYPEAAKTLPRVGSYDRFDLEAILAMQPDLLIGWVSGNPSEQLAQLEKLGIPIYYSELRHFDDVSSTIRRLGKLAGTDQQSEQAATDFSDGIAKLRQRYRNADKVRVFQQIWVNPLMTVNNQHMISEATRLCGGDNIFGELSGLTTRIDQEAVLARNPEAIVAGGMGEENPGWLDDWRRFDGLTAVRRNNLFFVPPSTLQRPTPRLLDGAKLLCQHLETARERR
ncbi:ABC-type Fe3+-hydroxamate transport system, periplasmic component [Spongiibacter sp. IMCC21906]|uniref:cobalamin-binding protein n=1 Tax=Spongiibacter sp. IMCC21906 TaxID=1620392 RepID=UPI00062DFF9B|nr:cobalamin-binding protein [Spongiibacter sp. IMCC21906]AKH68929.1 ABC-type Fe3+-hydroxamate transport system, periplasmic component [Spongiibacter sp. IMCC21906]